ncbi:hypothetical protein BCR39DRAFT_505231 [Naematelia encephala]|uniref:Uncharacterized protein n=1 Tax=Naematelia encephala TaxID=71784 RepID=A0A1Y2B5U8_9TREE|nr:hypothetical protein BCR39DRAFT_505231 [Naematelia encephala]
MSRTRAPSTTTREQTSGQPSTVSTSSQRLPKRTAFDTIKETFGGTSDRRQAKIDSARADMERWSQPFKTDSTYDSRKDTADEVYLLLHRRPKSTIGSAHFVPLKYYVEELVNRPKAWGATVSQSDADIERLQKVSRFLEPGIQPSGERAALGIASLLRESLHQDENQCAELHGFLSSYVTKNEGTFASRNWEELGLYGLRRQEVATRARTAASSGTA